MSRRIIIGLLVLLILGAVIWLLYRSGFREGNVILEISAPKEAAAGEEIEYKVVIENKNSFDLRDVKLSFSYPEGAVGFNEEGQPLNSRINHLGLTELESRSKKEFVLKAVLTGGKGEIKKASANLTYNPSKIKSVFQKKAEASTVIFKNSISLTLSGPPNIISSQTVQISLDLRNETENDFENLEAVFSYPDGFSFKKATPAPDGGNNVFRIINLSKGEGVRISIEGEISGFEKEGKRFIAVLKKRIGDRFFDFQKEEILLTVSTPLLTTEVLVNNSDDYLAAPGERLKYTISLANNSNNNFSALELSAKLEGQMFDFSTIKSSGFFDQNSRTIFWNAASEPFLSNLASNQKGEVSFEIELKDDFPKVFAKNYSLKVSSLIQTSSVPPDFNLDKVSASAELITKIKSKTEFTAESFYNDSVFSNSGPTPPRVSQKTTYTIHWKIVNKGSDLTNVKVASVIPIGISFENRTKTAPTQSGLEYNPSTGQIVWSIPTIPAGTGVTTPAFEAVFQVGLTPSVNQVGQTPEILKESVLEAVDNFTKEKINLTKPGITVETVNP